MTEPTGSPELAREREHLDKARRDIAAGEERIVQQRELIERLRQSQQSVVAAENLLETLHQTLQAWRDHRDLILQRIAHLEGQAVTAAGQPPPA